MRSLKSLLLGTIIVLIHAVADACLDLPAYQTMLCLGLVTTAALALAVNPFCRSFPCLKTFSRNEIAVVATMVLVGGTLIGAGIPARLIGLATTLYNHRDIPQRQAWGDRIVPTMPDHLFISVAGSRTSAQHLHATLREIQQLEQDIDSLKSYQAKANADLEELFRKHLQMEANAYGCKAADIAATRERQEELTRQLIQVTRTLNELKTDPQTSEYKTLEEAVALNRKMAALKAQLASLTRERLKVRKQLDTLFQNPKQQELPKIAAVKLDIQALQETLSLLTIKIHEKEDEAEKKRQQADQHRAMLQDGVQPARDHIQDLATPKANALPITSMRQVREMMRNIPWRIWLNPLLGWGTLLVLSIVATHNLAILLTRQWTITAPHQKPDFPLAHILNDALPNDERHQGLDLLHRPSFHVGLVIGLVWTLVTHVYFPQGLAFSWQDRVPPQFQTAASELVLSFSLVAFAVAFIIPRSLTASLWGIHLLGAAALAAAGSLLISLPSGDGGSLSLPSLLGNGKGALVFGATVLFALSLLGEARNLLFCAFHPYDIPQTKRAERRDLTHASAYFLLALIGLLLGLNLILDLTLEMAAAVTGLFVLAITILMRLSAETGIGTMPGFGTQHWFHTIPYLQTPPVTLILSLFTVPANSPLTGLLPHTVRLRNETRSNYAFYQLAVILATVTALVVSTCTLLGFAYARQLPAKSIQAMDETQALFNALVAGDSLQLPLHMLLIGVFLQGLLLVLRRRFTWMPHPISVICLAFPFMRQTWLPLLLGWCIAVLTARFLPRNQQDNLRALAIGALAATLFLISWLA